MLLTPGGEGRISSGLVVRFTGPDQLIGSGHPPKDSRMPAALGLIRSDDAGRTWRSVSQLGVGDFHVIASTGGLLAAPRYGLSQILLSRDGGHRFENRAGPLPLVDLAIDPADSTRWVATAETGLFVSLDEGRTWRQRDRVPNAHLAWVRPDALYRVEPDGPVKVSTDGGRAWIARGDAGGEPQAVATDAAGVLYVALLDGSLKRSSDGGRTWTIRVQGAEVR